jgi:hypothetical protein
MMRRRDVIAGLGTAAAWPLAARAQQPALPVVGFLNSETPASARESQLAFRRGLADSGYVDGRNVSFEYRWAYSQNDRLPSLAIELARRRVALIATGGTPAAFAAKEATKTAKRSGSTSPLKLFGRADEGDPMAARCAVEVETKTATYPQIDMVAGAAIGAAGSPP